MNQFKHHKITTGQPKYMEVHRVPHLNLDQVPQGEASILYTSRQQGPRKA